MSFKDDVYSLKRLIGQLNKKLLWAVILLLGVVLFFPNTAKAATEGTVPVEFRVTLNYDLKKKSESGNYYWLEFDRVVVISGGDSESGNSPTLAYDSDQTKYMVTLSPGDTTVTESFTVNVKADKLDLDSQRNYICLPQINGSYSESEALKNVIGPTYASSACGRIESGSGGDTNSISFADIIIDGKTVTSDKIRNQVDPPKGASEQSIRCKSKGGMTWLVCGMANVLSDSIGVMEDMIKDLMGSPVFKTDGPVYDIWSKTRTVATGLFILAFLAIIFSNAISLNIDAYTIKKILPRLVAAAVLVQFSFLISSIAIGISNILGYGLDQTLGGNLSAWYSIGNANSTAISWGTTGQGFGIVGLLNKGPEVAAASLGLAIIAFFGVMATLITLAARLVIVFLLVAISPIAFIAWILPNTENAFRFWYKLFTRVLIMFPMIVLLFKATELAGSIAITNPSNNSITLEASNALLQLIIIIVPLYLVPFTFKISGSVMTMAASAIASRRSGGKDKETTKQTADKRGANRQTQKLNLHGGTANLFGVGKLTGSGVLHGKGGSMIRRGKQEGLVSAQMQAEFNKNGFGANQLKQIAASPTGAKVSQGFAVTAESRVQAVRQLISNGQYGEVSKISQQIRQNYGADDEVSQSFNKAVAPYAGEIAEKIPQILVDSPGKVWSGEMTPDQFALLDAEGKKSYMSFASQMLEWANIMSTADQKSPAFQSVIHVYIQNDKQALLNQGLIDEHEQIKQSVIDEEGKPASGLSAIVKFVKHRADEIKQNLVGVIKKTMDNPELQAFFKPEVVADIGKLASPDLAPAQYRMLARSLSDEDRSYIRTNFVDNPPVAAPISHSVVQFDQDTDIRPSN